MSKISTMMVVIFAPVSILNPNPMYLPLPLDVLLLPLSHKSGALCLYEPLPVSDALGDDFFEIFDVFLVETFFSFF